MNIPVMPALNIHDSTIRCKRNFLFTIHHPPPLRSLKRLRSLIPQRPQPAEHKAFFTKGAESFIIATEALPFLGRFAGMGPYRNDPAHRCITGGMGSSS
jgi:hypothetical protein